METTGANFLDQFPTQKEVENLFNAFDSTREAHKEASNYRMENYFNCVDDYSWGGICDKAQDQKNSLMYGAQHLLTMQLEEGKPFVREFRIPVLMDLQGNVVSEKIIEGKFGDCWIIKTGENVSFVSLAKKQETYNKKGFKVMDVVYTLEYYYLAKMCKNGLISKGRVLSKELQEIERLPVYKFHTEIDSVLYWALRGE